MKKLIKNGTLLTMATTYDGPMDVLIDGTKISRIEKNIQGFDDAFVYDATGMFVMPGMIDAHCHIGMTEDGVGIEGIDVNEIANPITPQLCSIDGANPMNGIFKESAEAGITTICTGTGSANVVSGTFCILKTYGSRIDEMIVKNPAALKASFGENPKRFHGQFAGNAPVTRMGSAAMLRECFYKAICYMKKQNNICIKDNKKPSYDWGMEMFAKVLKREIPLKCHAHTASDTYTAIRIAKEFNIDIILVHCTDGITMIKDIKEEGYPIILGPLMHRRGKIENISLSYFAPAELCKNGVKFAFSTDAPVIPQRLLSIAIGYTVALGMDSDEALRSITINPAEILGIADRVGSLEVGKDADVVVYDGHPFDLEAKIRLVFINGQVIKNSIK